MARITLSRQGEAFAFVFVVAIVGTGLLHQIISGNKIEGIEDTMMVAMFVGWIGGYLFWHQGKRYDKARTRHEASILRLQESDRDSLD